MLNCCTVTTEDSTLAEPGSSVSTPSQPLSPFNQQPDPDNPPWGVLAALLTWAGSVLLLWLAPQLCALPYLVAHYRGGQAPTTEMLLSDRTFVLVFVICFFPAAVFALFICSAICSPVGQIPRAPTLGL